MGDHVVLPRAMFVENTGAWVPGVQPGGVEPNDQPVEAMMDPLSRDPLPKFQPSPQLKFAPFAKGIP